MFRSIVVFVEEAWCTVLCFVRGERFQNCLRLDSKWNIVMRLQQQGLTSTIDVMIYSCKQVVDPVVSLDDGNVVYF